jgi:hypothetical protein
MRTHMKIPHFALTAAMVLSFAGCSSSPTTVAVTTRIESDAKVVNGMSLTSVWITVSTPTPMTTVPLLRGPRPGTGPVFSDEQGREFVPQFDYGKGPGASYIISMPGLHYPGTSITLRVAFPLDQIPANSQELYLDTQLVMASIPPVPVRVRLR